MSLKYKIAFSLLLIFLGIATRILPHAWNFAPVAAIAIFSGFYLGKRYSIVVPVATMIIGDFFIGFYELPLLAAVYGSLITAGLIASALRKYKSVESIFVSSIAASLIFFVVTNWAVWQFSPWYAKTFSGLIQTYYVALPFFRNTLMGDLFYTIILCGSFEAVIHWSKARSRSVSI